MTGAYFWIQRPPYDMNVILAVAPSGIEFMGKSIFTI